MHLEHIDALHPEAPKAGFAILDDVFGTQIAEGMTARLIANAHLRGDVQAQTLREGTAPGVGLPVDGRRVDPVDAELRCGLQGFFCLPKGCRAPMLVPKGPKTESDLGK